MLALGRIVSLDVVAGCYEVEREVTLAGQAIKVGRSAHVIYRRHQRLKASTIFPFTAYSI